MSPTQMNASEREVPTPTTTAPATTATQLVQTRILDVDDATLDTLVLAPIADLVELPIDADVVVWHPRRHVPLHLDPVATVIWWHIESTSVAEIIHDVATYYRTDPAQVAPGVRYVCRVLSATGLINEVAGGDLDANDSDADHIGPMHDDDALVDHQRSARVNSHVIQWLARRAVHRCTARAGSRRFSIGANTSALHDQVAHLVDQMGMTNPRIAALPDDDDAASGGWDGGERGGERGRHDGSERGEPDMPGRPEAGRTTNDAADADDAADAADRTVLPRYVLVDAAASTSGATQPGHRFWLLSDTGLPLECSATADEVIAGLRGHIDELDLVQHADGLTLRLGTLIHADHVIGVQWDLLAARPSIETALHDMGYRIGSGQWIVIDPHTLTVPAPTGPDRSSSTSPTDRRPLAGIIGWFGPGSLPIPTSDAEWVWTLGMFATASTDRTITDRHATLTAAVELSNRVPLIANVDAGPSATLEAVATISTRWRDA